MTEKQKEFEQIKSKAEQYDQYLAKQNQEIISSWKAANENLASIKETDKRYERIKPVLAKLKKAEEGKELSAADAKYNLDLYDIMVSTGGLSDEEKGNYPNYPVSILDLMDCRVKTVNKIIFGRWNYKFQSLI